MLCWRSHWSHHNRLRTVNNCTQPDGYKLLTSNIAFVSIIICIQDLCYLSMSDQPLSTSSEWEMMWPHHIPALSASNLRHIEHFTSLCQIELNYLTFPHPAPPPQFPRRTISNVKYLNHVHQVCAESCAIGCMDECSMTVVIQTDSYQALTALCMTLMTSLT